MRNYHEIIHPLYGIIKFSSEIKMIGDFSYLEFNDPEGDFMGNWDRDFGGSLSSQFGNLESSQRGYIISEILIYREIKGYYPGFFNEDFPSHGNLLPNMEKEIEIIMKIIQNDPGIEYDSNSHKRGLIFGIPFLGILSEESKNLIYQMNWDFDLNEDFPEEGIISPND